MWNLNIPKKAFFYWGADKLSFLRYMTIHSFKKYNPEWEIHCYCPKQLNNTALWGGKQFENGSDIEDYTERLNQIGVTLMVFDFETIGLNNDLNEVHKSDFLRYHLLHTQGGVWADMDILFFRSMDYLLCNEQIEKSNAYIYYGVDPQHIQGHAIGFLMGVPGNKYYKDVFDMAKKHFSPKAYQGAGPDMLNNHMPLSYIEQNYAISDVCFLDKNSVYSIDHNQYKILYDFHNTLSIPDNAVGIHWYGGSVFVKDILLSINHKNYKQYNNNGMLIHLLQQYFKEDF